MFFGIDKLQELAVSIKTTAGGEIAIGTIQSIATIELPAAIGQFYRKHDDIRFMVHSRNTPAILDAVQLRQFDLGVVGRNPPYSGVEVLFQAAVPYVCLMPETHKLTEQTGKLDIGSIVDSESFVTFGGAFPDEMMSIDAALSKRLQRQSRLSATNMPVAASLVRETGALAITDPFSAEQAVRLGGVAFRPVAQDLSYHLALVTSQRERLSQPAIAFSESFAAQLEARIAEVKRYS
jgi:DNA-binding transcriptional LysR family regulator